MSVLEGRLRVFVHDLGQARCVDDEGCKGEQKVDLIMKHKNLQLRSNRPDLWCVCYVNILYIQYMYI